MKTIKDQIKELKEQEEQIRTQLDESEDKLREQTNTIGKIALISGLVALLGYLGYKTFFAEKKKSKKKKKGGKNPIRGRIGQLITPFIINFLTEKLELNKDNKTKKINPSKSEKD